MEVKKQRFGAVGGKLNYSWNVNTGEFLFIPSYDDATRPEKRERAIRQEKKKFSGDKEDVF